MGIAVKFDCALTTSATAGDYSSNLKQQVQLTSKQEVIIPRHL